MRFAIYSKQTEPPVRNEQSLRRLLEQPRVELSHVYTECRTLGPNYISTRHRHATDTRLTCNFDVETLPSSEHVLIDQLSGHCATFVSMALSFLWTNLRTIPCHDALCLGDTISNHDSELNCKWEKHVVAKLGPKRKSGTKNENLTRKTEI